MMPTMSVPTTATTCNNRRSARMGVELEGLSNREVEAETARLGFAVHQQPLDWIELVPQVGTDRADRRVIAEAGAHVVPHVTDVEVPGLLPDVSAVQEEHAPQVSPDRHTGFDGEIGERVAADR